MSLQLVRKALQPVPELLIRAGKQFRTHARFNKDREVPPGLALRVQILPLRQGLVQGRHFREEVQVCRLGCVVGGRVLNVAASGLREVRIVRHQHIPEPVLAPCTVEDPDLVGGMEGQF